MCQLWPNLQFKLVCWFPIRPYDEQFAAVVAQQKQGVQGLPPWRNRTTGAVAEQNLVRAEGLHSLPGKPARLRASAPARWLWRWLPSPVCLAGGAEDQGRGRMWAGGSAVVARDGRRAG